MILHLWDDKRPRFKTHMEAESIFNRGHTLVSTVAAETGFYLIQVVLKKCPTWIFPVKGNKAWEVSSSREVKGIYHSCSY